MAKEPKLDLTGISSELLEIGFDIGKRGLADEQERINGIAARIRGFDKEGNERFKRNLIATLSRARGL